MSQRFLIIGNHPHEGEIGECVPGDAPGTIQGINAIGDGEFMALIKLHNCEHGTDSCYAKRVNLRMLPDLTPQRKTRR